MLKEILLSLSSPASNKSSFSITIAHEVDIVQTFALHHLVLHNKAELDQFADGFESCAVLAAIRSNVKGQRLFYTCWFQ